MNHKLDSLDGKIGKVKDFYFDDQYWTIRYLVADTGGWLSDRQVLISPYALVAVVGEDQHIAVDLTKRQSFPRGHQVVAEIHKGHSAQPGL